MSERSSCCIGTLCWLTRGLVNVNSESYTHLYHHWGWVEKGWAKVSDRSWCEKVLSLQKGGRYLGKCGNRIEEAQHKGWKCECIICRVVRQSQDLWLDRKYRFMV